MFCGTENLFNANSFVVRSCLVGGFGRGKVQLRGPGLVWILDGLEPQLCETVKRTFRVLCISWTLGKDTSIYILRRFPLGVMTYMNIGMMPPRNPTHGPEKNM